MLFSCASSLQPNPQLYSPVEHVKYDLKDLQQHFRQMIGSVWKEVYPCAIAQQNHIETPILLAVPSESPFTDLFISELKATAPSEIKLMLRHGSFLPRPEDRAAAKQFLASAAFGMLVVNPEANRVEVELVIFILDQIRLCRKGPLRPIIIKTFAFSLPELAALLRTQTQNNKRTRSGKLIIDSFKIRNTDQCKDSLTAFGANSQKPDVRICLFSSRVNSCTPVFYDSDKQENLGPKAVFEIPSNTEFELLIEDVDKRGNVLYPVESSQNRTFARIRFPNLPPQLELLGFLELSTGCLESLVLRYQTTPTPTQPPNKPTPKEQ